MSETLSDLSSEKRWLGLILGLGTVLRLGMALYLGNQAVSTPAAYDQIFFHDMALNLLAGKGFVFTRPPWPFIQPNTETAFVSFAYELFLTAIYRVFGPFPLAARIVQALICSLMPLLIYRLTRRVLAGSPAWGERAGVVALVSAAVTAVYAYFVYYSATLMTEGLYLLAIAWSLLLTLDLAEAPTVRRWGLWGLAVGLAILLRQVFMPMAGLLALYVVWRARGRVRLAHLVAAAAVIAALILPFTVRNYRVFGRFLLLNSQAGQVFWNANHPDLGVQFESAMFPIPDDLQGSDEVTLNNELMRRGLKLVADDPGRFLRLSLDRFTIFFMFWPARESSTFSNIARTASFGVFLPFMLGGLALSLREWRRWTLFYAFIALYTVIHVISWVQIRYRMPVDLALVPFAAMALVALGTRFIRRAQS